MSRKGLINYQLSTALNLKYLELCLLQFKLTYWKFILYIKIHSQINYYNINFYISQLLSQEATNLTWNPGAHILLGSFNTIFSHNLYYFKKKIPEFSLLSFRSLFRDENIGQLPPLHL